MRDIKQEYDRDVLGIGKMIGIGSRLHCSNWLMILIIGLTIIYMNLVGGLEHVLCLFIFPFSWECDCIPTDELICFSEGLKPPARMGQQK